MVAVGHRSLSKRIPYFVDQFVMVGDERVLVSWEFVEDKDTNEVSVRMLMPMVQVVRAAGLSGNLHVPLSYRGAQDIVETTTGDAFRTAVLSTDGP
jgi:hypothetical protein